jgi:DNA helicase-2/ATP-dependent DNA helicase PcrA
MEEGLLPHRRSIELEGAAIDEERRLCYVGITRAQDRLTISLALGRMKWGKPRASKPSRFLFEITGQGDSPRPKRPAASPKAATRQPTSRPAAKPPRPKLI